MVVNGDRSIVVIRSVAGSLCLLIFVLISLTGCGQAGPQSFLAEQNLAIDPIGPNMAAATATELDEQSGATSVTVENTTDVVETETSDGELNPSENGPVGLDNETTDQSATVPPDQTSTPDPSGEPTDSGLTDPEPILLSEATASCESTIQHMRERTLALINTARSTARYCGSEYFEAAPALEWNDSLQQAAQTHSDDMSVHNFFSHTGSDGSSIGLRVTETAYRWSRVGENIAAGQGSASIAIDGWIDSPGHCSNLMNPDFTEVAVACSEDNSSDYSRYWTNVLATQ